MTVTAGDCVICELEQVLRDWSRDLRQSLHKMNPVTDPNYDWQFEALVYADQDLRTLRGQDQSRRKPS